MAEGWCWGRQAVGKVRSHCLNPGLIVKTEGAGWGSEREVKSSEVGDNMGGSLPPSLVRATPLIPAPQHGGT